MRLRDPTTFLLLLLGTTSATVDSPAQVPFELEGPGVSPADFRVTLFAGSLNYPKGLQLLPDGSLLVATSDPRPGSQGFYSSTGTLRRLHDADGDGEADGPGTALVTGLPGSLSGLRVRGPLVFAVSTGARITVLRLGAAPDAPLVPQGRLSFALPDGWLHPPSDLEVREAPGAPGAYELYFQLGSQANSGVSSSTVALSSDLGASADLTGDSIYRLTLTDHGDRVSAADIVRIASGLRNAAGIAFRPGTDDLYFQDNGIDGFADPNEPRSADELNWIAGESLGGTVEDFGFPGSYVAYRTGTVVGGQGEPPLFAFQPLPEPTHGNESEGPAEIAFAPDAFPAALRDGVFLGFHGKFSQGGTQNEENPLVFASLASGEYFHVIPPRQPGVGHLDGLLATGDSLFVADLSTTGSLSNGAGRGAIYQIRVTAAIEPRFRRGDADGDGQVDMADAIQLLGHLFLAAAAPRCPDAADANDDGELDVADPVAILLSLFAGRPALPPPGPEPGTDPTPDGLGCGGG